MKNTKKITVKELVEILATWNKGAKPASIQYVTEPKLTKEGKARFGDVIKFAHVGCMIGYNYENSVNNQLEREGKEREFLSQPLWNGKGKRISTALSKHIEKGQFYLTYKAQQTMRSLYFDSTLKPIPNSLIKAYFPKSDPAKSQGVDKPVYHREIAIEHIKRLKYDGKTFIIV
jgi:hypothetical protein